MKKVYCKYCGLELENGMCTCERFLHNFNERVKETRVCDTCQKHIDEDAVYCPYCGIPLDIDGNIESLKKELKGENAKDVIEVYDSIDRKNGVTKKKNKIIGTVITMVLSIMIVMIASFAFVIPFIRQKIDDYKVKKFLETAESVDEKEELRLDPTSDRVIQYGDELEETSQPTIELKDTWVKRDGYFYAFDKNGDPVVDDWVTETNDEGVEQKYYFDVDGRLVVNSWIDGEYYVGADGAMLRDHSTPDGAYVDEDGRVLLQGGQEVNVERDTFVYYEAPNSSETITPTAQKSSNSGEIKGVDPQKTYQLYVKNIKQERDTVTNGDLKCNITYYLPVIAGVDSREVTTFNSVMEATFYGTFKEKVRELANRYQELPKSITFTVVDQRNVTSNKMTIITQGKLIPRKGVSEKKKFRFVYDRKSKTMVVTDISD